MSVRRDYCGMRLLVQVSGREAQILNRAPRGNGDVDRVTDRGRQRHPPACRHTVSPTGAALAGSPQASRAHIVGLGIEDSRQLSTWRCRSASQPRGSILDRYRPTLVKWLDDTPELSTPSILERLRTQGYEGGISILRDLVKQLRPRPTSESRLRNAVERRVRDARFRE